MKTRNTLIVIAIILILFNGLSYIAGNVNIPEGNTENKIAYLIGRNFSFLAGLILLLIAFFIHRKVNRKRKKEMIDSFLK